MRFRYSTTETEWSSRPIIQKHVDVEEAVDDEPMTSSANQNDASKLLFRIATILLKYSLINCRFSLGLRNAFGSKDFKHLGSLQIWEEKILRVNEIDLEDAERFDCFSNVILKCNIKICFALNCI